MNLNFYSSLEKILSSSEVKFLFTLDKEKEISILQVILFCSSVTDFE